MNIFISILLLLSSFYAYAQDIQVKYGGNQGYSTGILSITQQNTSWDVISSGKLRSDAIILDGKKLVF